MSRSLLSTLLPCCFTSNPYASADAYLQPLTLRGGGGAGASDGARGRGGAAPLEDVLDASAAAREALWRRLGTLEPLALSHLVAGAAGAGPKWPAGRCAFRMVRRPNGNIILASDGLSDPFDDLTLGDGNVNGYGLEFYIEAPASELAPSVHDAKASWQFQLLYTVSQLAAGHGGMRAIMDEMRLLSTEAEGVAAALPAGAAAAHVNAAGRVGALLGLRSRPGDADATPDRIDGMPLTDVLLVNVKLLTLDELATITARGAEGRAALDAAFTGRDRLVSSLARGGGGAP